MANLAIYPKGVMVFAPNEKAPDFVVGTLIITPKDFLDWLKDGEGKDWLTEYTNKEGTTVKQIKLSITRKQDGQGLNLKVDTFKPMPKSASNYASQPSSQSKSNDNDPF